MDDKQIVRIEVPMKLSALVSFGIKHTYSRINGWFSGVLGAAMVIAGILLLVTNQASASMLILMVALGFSVMGATPFQVYVDAKSQMRRNNTFNKPIMYILNGNGITVLQGKNKRMFKWGDIRQVISTKKAIALYYSRENAMVIPRDVFEEKRSKFMPFFEEYIDEDRMKI